jgi:hypothetical protein
MNKVLCLIALISGLTAVIIQSQILALVSINNAVIFAAWYIKEGN